MFHLKLLAIFAAVSFAQFSSSATIPFPIPRPPLEENHSSDDLFSTLFDKGARDDYSRNAKFRQIFRQT
ncbi:Oidioi.mRNA.OKI2018_I69.chr2.g5480.t1.cds [Oikopleura dioica]|uniref:Oidioi.mRNA.OKI2018_I69.chr2.g5480.t1.cds n=1 Tax=Oikopleura dioica TaxID=34765 RepID=A0ABN7T3T2_OIKDI|nr:Oidioi.mRNA.OKI2018_I69.chr2.g5480.t1.cds [Oikopleura dioica]